MFQTQRTVISNQVQYSDSQVLVIFHSLLYLMETHQVTYIKTILQTYSHQVSSHHKLTCFEYADGANAVRIKDSFIDVTSTSTDLDMYYQKVGDVYDAGTGRPIEPDFPSGSLDFPDKS